MAVVHTIVREYPNVTVAVLLRAYNERVAAEHRVHRSTFLRRLRSAGYKFKKSYPGPQNVEKVQAEISRAERRAQRKALRLERLRLLIKSRPQGLNSGVFLRPAPRYSRYIW